MHIINWIWRPQNRLRAWFTCFTCWVREVPLLTYTSKSVYGNWTYSVVTSKYCISRSKACSKEYMQPTGRCSSTSDFNSFSTWFSVDVSLGKYMILLCEECFLKNTLRENDERFTPVSFDNCADNSTSMSKAAHQQFSEYTRSSSISVISTRMTRTILTDDHTSQSSVKNNS